MGSELDPENIKEGDDVYFECHINANPRTERIRWYHNGVPLEPKRERGVIESNQSLALQDIRRAAGGFYTCSATNSEGDGESLPVQLKIKFRPYCRNHSKHIYGTALNEPVSVTCEVEASPGPVTFRWTFNNTSENLPISSSAVTSHEFTSVATYAPKSHLDYGTLLCWAFNNIGTQMAPCVFSIIPAGPPDAPNCSIVNQTTDTIEVDCLPGFDGGIPQTFYMEVYDSATATKLFCNLSSAEPSFVLTSLRSGLGFLMYAYAANGKGRSSASRLETFTLKVAEKRTGPPSFFEFKPVLGILIGVFIALTITTLVILTAMKYRKSDMEGHGNSGPEQKPLNVQQPLQRLKEPGMPSVSREGVDPEENDPDSGNDPDVIPHSTDMMLAYSEYKTRERGQCTKKQLPLDPVPNVQSHSRQPSSYKYPSSSLATMDLAHHILSPKMELPANVSVYATLGSSRGTHTKVDSQLTTPLWTQGGCSGNESIV